MAGVVPWLLSIPTIEQKEDALRRTPRYARAVEEKVSKQFLLDLLEPFHPTLKANERISDVNFENELDDTVIKYYIVKEV